jgi:hypothetical protein
MVMIQRADTKSALNRSKSFFSVKDMNKFIALLFLDLSQTYFKEGGEKGQIIAIKLLKKGMEFAQQQKITEQLVEFLYQLGQESESKGEIETALQYYHQTAEYNHDYQEVSEKIEKLSAILDTISADAPEPKNELEADL